MSDHTHRIPAIARGIESEPRFCVLSVTSAA